MQLIYRGRAKDVLLESGEVVHGGDTFDVSDERGAQLLAQPGARVSAVAIEGTLDPDPDPGQASTAGNEGAGAPGPEAAALDPEPALDPAQMGAVVDTSVDTPEPEATDAEAEAAADVAAAAEVAAEADAIDAAKPPYEVGAGHEVRDPVGLSTSGDSPAPAEPEQVVEQPEPGPLPLEPGTAWPEAPVPEAPADVAPTT